MSRESTMLFPNSIQAQLREFYARGGLINGLNPAVIGRIWYVTGELPPDSLLSPGSDSNTGRTPTNPYSTMERVLGQVDTFDLIVVNGLFREQVVAPDGVENVTIMAPIVRPRQATSSGIPTGGGASWLPPSSGATAGKALLELIRPGWSIMNLQMAPLASSACIRLTTSAVDDLLAAGHASFFNCFFTGSGAAASIGIEDNGGSGFVQILASRFLGLLDTAIKTISTANAVPLSWQINGNSFQQNLNDIKMSLSYAQIMQNDFMTAGSGATNKVVQTNLNAQGNNNHVRLNQFSNTAAQIQNANGYNGGAADTWVNYVNDNSGALVAGVPGA